MSMADKYAFLMRLYTDDSYRELFYLAPETTFCGYDLSSAEKTQLRSIDQVDLHKFADSLRAKMMASFMSKYSIIYEAYPRPFMAMFNRAYDIIGYTEAEALAEYQIRLAKCCLEQMRHADMPESCLDIIDYLITVGMCHIDRYYPYQTHQLTENAKPKRHPKMYLKHYKYDPVTLLANSVSLNQTVLQEVAPDPTSYIIYQYNSALLKVKVGAGIVSVLNLCNGMQCVNDIQKVIASKMKDDVEKSKRFVAECLSDMLNKGWIYI